MSSSPARRDFIGHNVLLRAPRDVGDRRGVSPDAGPRALRRRPAADARAAVPMRLAECRRCRAGWRRRLTVAPMRCCISPRTAIRRCRSERPRSISRRTRSALVTFLEDCGADHLRLRLVRGGVRRPGGAVTPADAGQPAPAVCHLEARIASSTSAFSPSAARASAATSTCGSSAPTVRTSRRGRSRRDGCAAMAAGQREFTVRGNGGNLIDFMYVDDAVDGFLRS